MSESFNDFVGAKAAKPPMPSVIDVAQYTHVGNAKWFIRLHQRNVRYVKDWKCWMVWDGMRWTPCESDEMTGYVELLTVEMRNHASQAMDSDIADKLRKHANATESLSNMISTIRTAKNDQSIQAKPDDFDANKYLINFANGTLDLKTGKLREFCREDYMTKRSLVPMDPAATCPTFIRFLNEIFEGKQDIIKYIQTMFGMCMTGDVSQEQLFILWGATANNGKGTLVEAISYVLADYRVALPVSSLASHTRSAIPNDIAMLKGARLCTVNEPRDNEPLDAGTIKSITDKGQISARFLGKEFFKFWQTHHTVITTNPKPNIKMDAGMKRRLVLIPFYFSPAVVDLNLDMKLQAEATGIINWLLEGCLNWQKNGLVQPYEIREAINEYNEEMDPLMEFWNVCIEKDKTATTPHNLLFTIYKLWCEANDIHAKGAKAFTQMILNKGFRKIVGRDSTQTVKRSFTGLRGTQKATEIAIRYLNLPGREHEWAIEQFQQWESWGPRVVPTMLQRYPEIFKMLREECADGTEIEVDTTIKVFFEDIDDDTRAEIVKEYQNNKTLKYEVKI